MPHRKLEFEIGNGTPNCLRHHVWLDVSTFNKCLFTTKQGGFLLILICETSQIFVWRNKAFIFFQKSDIDNPGQSAARKARAYFLRNRPGKGSGGLGVGAVLTTLTRLRSERSGTTWRKVQKLSQRN